MVLASSGIEHDIKIWTPKAIEKATLPKIIEQKPRTRGWMYQIASPEDLMLQLFSLPRRSRTESNGENSNADRELLDLIWTFNANSDSSNDDDDGDVTSQDDLFS